MTTHGGAKTAMGVCFTCKRKTPQIRRTVYAGDYYHPDPVDELRQCTECGWMYMMQRVGRTKRMIGLRRDWLPPRCQWERPKA